MYKYLAEGLLFSPLFFYAAVIEIFIYLDKNIGVCCSTYVINTDMFSGRSRP